MTKFRRLSITHAAMMGGERRDAEVPAPPLRNRDVEPDAGVRVAIVVAAGEAQMMLDGENAVGGNIARRRQQPLFLAEIEEIETDRGIDDDRERKIKRSARQGVVGENWRQRRQ